MVVSDTGCQRRSGTSYGLAFDRPACGAKTVTLVPQGGGQDAMAQPFVGQVIAVGFNFAPVGWFLCNGQLLPISQYDVLFNLLGTTYGGDGISTFGLPNMNGRAPLCMGTGSGLSTYVLGQAAGTESVTLLSNQVGLHSHTLATSA